jgi:uncharacterized protein YeaO (DUF488 family)
MRELAKRPAALVTLSALARKRRVTLLFGAREEEHDNAVALAALLLETNQARTPPQRAIAKG